MMIRRGDRYMVGLEVGATAVKIAAVESARGEPKVVAAAVHDLPRPAPDVRMDESTISRAVGQVVADLHLKGARAVISVPAGQAFIQRLDLPHMPKSEIRYSLTWELKKHLPCPPEECEIAYLELEAGSEKSDHQQMSLLVAAVKKEIVVKLLHLTKEAGLQPEAVTVVPVGLSSLLALLPEAAEGGSAILDVGARATTVTFVHEGRLQFTREVPVAGDHLTQALCGSFGVAGETLELNFAQAEEIKCGLDHGAEALLPDAQAQAMVRTVVEKLVGEVRRSFGYYSAHVGGSVDRVFLSGGAIRLACLRQMLGEGLGLPTTPLALPGVENPEDAPRLATAVGLALSAGKGLNLIPQEFLAEKRAAGLLLAARLATFLLAGAVGLFYGGMLVQNAFHRRALKTREEEMSRLQPRVQQMQTVAEELGLVKKQLVRCQRLNDERLIWAILFQEIGRVTPPEVRLMELNYSSNGRGPVLHLQGLVRQTGSQRQSTLTRFVDNLRRIPVLTRAHLVYLDRTQVPNFEIVAWMK